MNVVKRIILILLCVICAAVTVYFGFFLVRTVFPAAMEQQVLDTKALFSAPKAEEPAPQTQTDGADEPLPEDPVVISGSSVEKAAAYLAGMDMEQKLWQLIFTTPDDLTGIPGATQAGDLTRQALAKYPVGGLCYFSANLEDREQVTALLQGTAQLAEIPVFLAVDEEGGIVSRLGSNEELGITALAPAAEYGAAGDAEAVRTAAAKLSQEMAALGFNMNFAPVADLAVEGNTEIGTRAYSADPAVVSQLSGAMVRALQDNGIAACLKHFPGHGAVQTDSHEGAAVSTRTLEQLRQEEFAAFRGGVEQGVLFVMMSHQSNESISSLPCSLSPEAVALLRGELGFGGVIITDSLKMGAVADGYSAEEAAVMAIEAGCDMVLMPADVFAAYDGLVAAVLNGRLTQQRVDESVLRILTAKYQLGIME